MKLMIILLDTYIISDIDVNSDERGWHLVYQAFPKIF